MCGGRQGLDLTITDALGVGADGPEVFFGAGFTILCTHAGPQPGGEQGALAGAGLVVPAVGGVQQCACGGPVTGAAQDLCLCHVGESEQPSVSGELGTGDGPVQGVGCGRVACLVLGASEVYAVQRGRPAETEPVC